MHYGDDWQLKNAHLEIVVYKHSTFLTGKWRERGKLTRKDGRIRRDCVDYEIANVQEMKFFPPNVFAQIWNDPWKWFSRSKLNELAFEKWYRVKILDLDGYGKVEIRVIEDVSLAPLEMDHLKLH